MSCVSRHKEFRGDYISKKVKTISDSTWIVYYYSKNPWPIANSDCVAKLTYYQVKTDTTAVFELIAVPNEYKKDEINRMTNYHVTYTFQDLGNELVKISVAGKSSPPVKVSKWLVKAAFPNAPLKSMRTLVKLIKEM